MDQKSIIFLIEEMGKKMNAAEQAKKAVMQHDPTASTSRFDEHIKMCEKTISQLNSKLLNSEYIIDEQLLVYLLEELEMKQHLERFNR